MEKRVRDLLDDQIHLYGIKSSLSNERNQLDISVDRPGGMSLEECSLLHREFYNSDFYEDYEDYDVTFGTPALVESVFSQQISFSIKIKNLN